MSKIWIAVIMAVTVIAGLAGPGLVTVQIATPEEVTATEDGPEPAVQKIRIRVRAMLATDVPLNEPVSIDLGALSVPGVSPALTRGVTVKAFTRYVEFEGSRVGQLVLTGVEKNGAREPLPSGLFNTQFDLEEPRLYPGEDVIMEGDAAPLIAALEKLAEAEKVAGDKKPEETALRDDRPAVQQNSGGGGTGNDLAGAYQAPAAVKVAPKQSVEGVNVTESGCTVRIDVAQMQAYRQNRIETVKDGVVISQTECSDDLSNANPLQKSYAVCTESVDLEAGTATAQYLLYYMDAGFARQEVSECTDDTDKVFVIVEKADGCSIFLDYTRLEAVPQVALVYQNDSNVEVQVQGCAASTTRLAVTMTPSADGCSIRHDFAARLSYQQSAYIYELGGIRYQAGGCTDTTTTYTHTKVYDDLAGGSVCSPVVDLASNGVTLQSRIQIRVDAASRFITDCTPDTSGLALTATTDGCNNPFNWEHDLSSSQSYGQERFYYTRGGTREYVTECRQSQAVYIHQLETTGWQDHNDQRFSYALSTVYITLPAGRYDVVVSQVLSGTQQMPYELSGTELRENGNSTYEGCKKFQNRDTIEVYTRPDGTEYDHNAGAALPSGPTVACSKVNSPWNYTDEHRSAVTAYGVCACRQHCSNSESGDECRRVCSGNQVTRYGKYAGTHQLVREDGATIFTDSAEREQTCPATCNGSGGECTPTLPGSTAQSIINDLGWN